MRNQNLFGFVHRLLSTGNGLHSSEKQIWTRHTCSNSRRVISRSNRHAHGIWFALFEHTPVPWTTPLPPFEPTILDATYVKINPRLATPFPCRRCPDYALEGGLWKFSLNKGIFRIYYTVNGWRSLGSYTVSDDRIYLFNDPYCHTGIQAVTTGSLRTVFSP
jgi:hypothetical protein